MTIDRMRAIIPWVLFGIIYFVVMIVSPFKDIQGDPDEWL